MLLLHTFAYNAEASPGSDELTRGFVIGLHAVVIVLPHLARHDSSMCCSFTGSHAVLVAGEQVASLGQTLPQAVAMQSHLRVGTAAEVSAAGFDTSW